jgi:hypothetical protein
MSVLGTIGCCAVCAVVFYLIGFGIGWMTHADMVANMSECEAKRVGSKKHIIIPFDTKEGGE